MKTKSIASILCLACWLALAVVASAQVTSYSPPSIRSIGQVAPTGGSAGTFLRYTVILNRGTDTKPMLAIPTYSGPLVSSVEGSVGYDLSYSAMDVVMSVKASSVIGAYKLEKLTITHSGGSTIYSRDGTIQHVGYPAGGLTTIHSLNFALGDISVVAPGGQLPAPADTSSSPIPRLYPVNMSAILPLGTNGTITLGFVISNEAGGTGGGKAKLLVRAVGPGLVKFGTGNLNTDPVLTVNAATAVTVDNWSESAESASVVEAAGNSSGAFPLVRGSKDAATVIEVPPGGLTVTVKNIGAGGEVLVEIYRVL